MMLSYIFTAGTVPPFFYEKKIQCHIFLFQEKEAGSPKKKTFFPFSSQKSFDFSSIFVDFLYILVTPFLSLLSIEVVVWCCCCLPWYKQQSNRKRNSNSFWERRTVHWSIVGPSKRSGVSPLVTDSYVHMLTNTPHRVLYYHQVQARNPSSIGAIIYII